MLFYCLHKIFPFQAYLNPTCVSIYVNYKLLFQITRGEECGALESVKAASELYSPVSGTVVEKNKAVEKGPGLINWSAEQDGWLFKIKLSDVTELENLMTKQNYEAYLKTQEEDGH